MSNVFSFSSDNSGFAKATKLPTPKLKIESPKKVARIHDKLDKAQEENERELRLVQEENERIENLIEYCSREAELIGIEESIKTLSLLVVRAKLMNRATFIIKAFIQYQESREGRISITRADSYTAVYESHLSWFSSRPGLFPTF